ncbi:hypothetical protein [Bradyrhizobium stylosanthis]|uniref:Uncharacterized protein n=1 Tax=Bradyrhizobium stylosanthis TaxID=1803665 RepID=A0A560EAS6_9BRAD|nr:hypothetical protein [Bradyrhizobium stylosanthis]TWB06461.1 hypothetical protein FBZ96_101273 [Bradyrhizobium stylosanthis]
MEDLVLAILTLALSVCFFEHLTQSGMDALFIIVSLASMPAAGYLAYERGRSQRRWVYLAAFIGPFALPALYFTAAVANLRGKDSVTRPQA